METWTGHKYTKEEIREISGIKTVKWLDDFEMTLRDLALSAENIYINLNEYSKYETEVTYRDFRFAEKIKSSFPAHHIERLAPIITSHRLVKEEEEIELMKKACNITNDAFKRVLSFVKPGVNRIRG